ncbi:MAG: hypothetical protein D9C04_01200 [Nitrosopumilus sp. B06]|nr:MAG: hypothetical protein EB828_02915 [Nitrosopumilus sp. D6]RNJ80512.1 MAG: hypothetical protein D9C04_01200 [Nitrosopumilus sp. B06]
MTLEIVGKSNTLCDLKRHLAPRTVGIILRSLPLEGNAHKLGSITYIETAVDSGMERARTAFKRGDVAFLPSSGGICFFAHDMSAKTMTPIGRLHDPGILNGIKPGDVLRLYAA